MIDKPAVVSKRGVYGVIHKGGSSLIGAFLGALIGELLVGKLSYDALKAGWGVFVGVMVGTLLKLIASGIMTFYFVKALF